MTSGHGGAKPLISRTRCRSGNIRVLQSPWRAHPQRSKFFLLGLSSQVFYRSSMCHNLGTIPGTLAPLGDIPDPVTVILEVVQSCKPACKTLRVCPGPLVCTYCVKYLNKRGLCCVHHRWGCVDSSPFNSLNPAAGISPWSLFLSMLTPLFQPFSLLLS